MTRAVPQDSEPYKQFSVRKAARLVHAVAAIGDAEANRILNADGPYFGNQVREIEGNAEAMQAFAANYTDCETIPSSAAPMVRATAPAAPAKPTSTVTAKDQESGNRAFRCAAMA